MQGSQSNARAAGSRCASSSLRRISVAAIALALAGCVGPPGFGPLNTRGNGYASSEISPGVHYIDYKFLRSEDRELVRQYWHRRAAQVCPQGYSVIAPEASGDPRVEPTATGGLHASGQVRCGQ